MVPVHVYSSKCDLRIECWCWCCRRHSRCNCSFSIKLISCRTYTLSTRELSFWNKDVSTHFSSAPIRRKSNVRRMNEWRLTSFAWIISSSHHPSKISERHHLKKTKSTDNNPLLEKCSPENLTDVNSKSSRFTGGNVSSNLRLSRCENTSGFVA